jgi:hypothetical protein
VVALRRNEEEDGDDVKGNNNNVVVIFVANCGCFGLKLFLLHTMKNYRRYKLSIIKFG